MHILPDADDWRIARSVHRRFASRPGSEHIATAGALAYLAAALRLHPAHSVLEFGAGIGTITYLLLSVPPGSRTVLCTETDPFCLEQLKRNIPEALRRRLTVLSDRLIPCDDNQLFDLAIIDGSIPKGGSYPFLRENVLCFIEGDRRKVRSLLADCAKAKGLACNFTRYPERGRGIRVRWHPSRLGFSRPTIRLRKYCSMGLLMPSVVSVV